MGLSRPWTYRVTPYRVVDGDTQDYTVDLGFYLTAKMRFRLLGVDTPERHEAGWAECTQYVLDWYTRHPVIFAQTFKADSFGRWVAEIYAERPEKPGYTDFLADDLQDLMDEHGWTSPAVR